MSRPRWLLPILAPVALLVVFLSGPRARVHEPGALPPIPRELNQLDSYLEASESRFDEVVPGTERRIVWADPEAPTRAELSVVYLHGFSATHRETAPLTEDLAAALDANAYLSRLTGHGRTGEALGAATADDWLRDTAEAMEIGRAIGRRVVVLGVSTGGTLATWAAAQPEWRADIAALILISPNYRVRDSRAWILTLPWGRQIGRLVQGPEYSFEPVNEDQRRYWTERYPTKVLPELIALTRFVDDRMAAAIRAPTLVFLASDDQVVDPAAEEEVFGELASSPKELVTVTNAGDPSHHVLAGDILSPGSTNEVLDRILRFLQAPS